MKTKENKMMLKLVQILREKVRMEKGGLKLNLAVGEIER
jgi:hypothetical protein